MHIFNKTYLSAYVENRVYHNICYLYDYSCNKPEMSKPSEYAMYLKQYFDIISNRCVIKINSVEDVCLTCIV